MGKVIKDDKISVYQTITGRHIPISHLSDEEYGFLELVAKKYIPGKNGRDLPRGGMPNSTPAA